MDYKLPVRVEISNKSTYGKVLNIAGSDYMSGAAYLSSIAPLKIGCGYCFLASTEKSISAVSAKTSNVVFLPLKEVEKRLNEFDVVEIGCGLSQGLWAVDIFNFVIDNLNLDTPLIIDADGLNILAKNGERFLKRGLKNVILTPHPKEAARLLECDLDDVLSDVKKSSLEISKKYNCVTVLKTHNTVVTSCSNEFYQNKTGNNSMAKAGSGDVLAGMITGLVAQKMEIFQAAALGTYLHGLCGDIAKEKLTQYSVMAEDLISNIPNAIKFYLNQN
jgi:NAD(P)H-hydrate epimerase